MVTTVTFDQQYYLEALVWAFSDYDGTGKPPKAVVIPARMRTIDPISMSEVADYINIKVISSG
jgi:hypothetical protein